MSEEGQVKIPAAQNLNGIYLLDTRHHGFEGTVGVFLLPLARGFALIESGPGSTLGTLETHIREAGFDPHDLKAVLVTHIHLDHAGAAGTLAQRYGADVYAHEIGAPHLDDPSRLMVSAKRIYGDMMDTLWGDMEAVPQGKLHALKHEDEITLGERRLKVLYTPGHASHHVAFSLDDGTMFTGDAAAVRLTGSAVVRPALPPPEAHLETWDETLKTMKKAGASRLLLTHYGEVMDVQEHLERVREQNHRWADTVREGLKRGEDDTALEARIADISVMELEAAGTPADVIARHRVVSNDAMTVMGIKRYWQKHHPEEVGG